MRLASAQVSQATEQHWRSNPLLNWLGRYWLMPAYFRSIVTVGLEHFPQQGSVLITPTHRSRWDGLVVAYALGPAITGRELRFMVSADEMDGLQGWFIRRCGGFPVDPLHPSLSMLRQCVSILKAPSQALVMFPEGRIFREQTVQPLREGVARIALQAGRSQLQVLPVDLKYERPFPQWGDRIEVHVGSPLDVAAYKTLPRKEGAAQLLEDLTERLVTLAATPWQQAIAHPKN